ncbi:unnamed protein product [Aphanomyces euteiches]|uniref:Crossover junction endonuclease MUS81 n=1 Tax=Aphanomyces euteiches TaxID=100861 RepID=A0A6G0WKM6_9STRA|nr:hypothetical protein Ae201684_014241 [Aphanomyces euteiches]KAH9069207.1 hypothetical protein Ae201684P_004897 [Aphanomyces euteiches]KAH9153553.1 hypothetical protein AeRB84_004208 [Aphanomyces euteiches]
MPPKCVNPANEFLVLEMEKLIEGEVTKMIKRGLPGQVNHTLTSYQRALGSIRACPDSVESGEQAKALRGVGNFIAQKINAILIRGGATTNLGEYTTSNAAQVDTQPKRPTASKKRKAPTTTTTSDGEGDKIYKPPKGKHTWFVLMALWDAGATSEARAIDVDTLLGEMKRLGFDGEKHQVKAALPNMASKYNVVAKRSDDGKVYLTLDGIHSVTECRRDAFENPKSSNSQQKQSQPSSQSSQRGVSDIVPFDWLSTTLAKLLVQKNNAPLPFHPNEEWEIVLLIDHREMISRTNRSVFERKLLEAQVTCEVRALNIGDMVWIARNRSRERNGQPEEYVFDVIVERKNVSDLASSIVDKRYTEQKARLQESGLRYVVYLVEGILSSQMTSIRGNGLQTALTRTQVQNNFFVYHGTSHDETVGFLTAVHRHLVDQFHKKIGCVNPPTRNLPYFPPPPQLHDLSRIVPWRRHSEFQSSSRKKAALSVGEIHQMMLMQIPRLGRATVLNVSSTFPTMSSLWTHVKAGRNFELRSSSRRIGEPSAQFVVDLCQRSTYD